jgi:hypothetical protein
MRISKKAIEKLLKRHLMELVPTAVNIPKKASTSVVNGKTQVIYERGDVYMSEQEAAAISSSVAEALEQELVTRIEDVIVAKVNEVVQQYNQLLADVEVSISTTAVPILGID